MVFRPQGLAFLALGFRPTDWFPVGGRNETRAGVRNLDPMAARLKNVQEESLLDSVLVWACLDLDAGLQKDVCGA